MLSARLLVCVAIATAVPLPSGKRKATPCGLLTISNLTQKAITKGGAAVSSTGATQGSGSVRCITVTPVSVEKLAAVGNSGVSGSGVSAGNGILKHIVTSGTVAKRTKDGFKAKSGTSGSGASGGGAGILQDAAANGGTKLEIGELAVLTDGKNLLKIKQVKKGSATTSSGHKASGSRESVFGVENRGGTEITLDELDVPKIPTLPKPNSSKSKGKKKSG
nr:CP19k-like protein 1 [Tetraclita japonica formosana]